MQENSDLGETSRSDKTTGKYFLIAVLCGSGFTALLILLLGLSFVPLSIVSTLLLAPGGIIASALAGSEGFGPPLLVLAVNSLVYSIAAFVGMSVLGRRIRAPKARFALAKLFIPVVILLALVCIPALDPLWPRRMVERGEQERSLQASLPVGMSLDAARTALRSRGIAFNDERETSSGVLLERRQASIRSSAGDQVISTRLETDAAEFPCGYDIEIVLVFDGNEVLKDRYIHRLRLCP